ncbi:flagellar basal body rod protein FlgC [Kangiella sp. HZ709]|uniref:flagellar basal body rod protein FlgC n=1 Tax=Kangiella sp. HZ709 TaxID=2666328 RepID=UPI0012B04DA7|nr:flagellar basal body rod C-terminal domain-containing protein [Kangiella sp. HZ709]MRX26852.1 hypothetical protein [Kangiella sp. HZ709]
MSFGEIYAISEYGMNLERMRLKAASLNIANENTIYSNNALKNKSNLGAVQVNASPKFIDSLNNSGSVSYYYDGDLRSVHKPNHSEANSDGMVFMPGISLSDQMITLTSSQRGYEANVKALNTIYSMAQKTMEIGKNR